MRLIGQHHRRRSWAPAAQNRRLLIRLIVCIDMVSFGCRSRRIPFVLWLSVLLIPACTTPPTGQKLAKTPSPVSTMAPATPFASGSPDLLPSLLITASDAPWGVEFKGGSPSKFPMGIVGALATDTRSLELAPGKGLILLVNVVGVFDAPTAALNYFRSQQPLAPGSDYVSSRSDRPGVGDDASLFEGTFLTPNHDRTSQWTIMWRSGRVIELIMMICPEGLVSVPQFVSLAARQEAKIKRIGLG